MNRVIRDGESWSQGKLVADDVCPSAAAATRSSPSKLGIGVHYSIRWSPRWAFYFYRLGDVLNHNTAVQGLKSVARQLAAPVRREYARIKLRQEYFADSQRYVKYMVHDDALAHDGMRPKNIEAQLTKDYHRIEKGLALPEPRRPFGGAVLARLDQLMPAADESAEYYQDAVSARQALLTWNEDGEISDEVSPPREIGDRGVSDINKFFTTRHSVRDYSNRPVDSEKLSKAVGLAIRTPSVCNRQAWKVRFFRGKRANDALRFQNGNRGFGHTAPVVALVTADLQLFAGAGERNQAWIEGGLFSMSLVMALHGAGLDTCMLNMSVRNDRTSNLRKEFEISDSEVIIMMMTIGYGRNGHRKARSPRRSVQDVMIEL